MNRTAKNVFWGAALLIMPGSCFVVGGFLLYKGLRKIVKNGRKARLLMGRDKDGQLK